MNELIRRLRILAIGQPDAITVAMTDAADALERSESPEHMDAVRAQLAARIVLLENEVHELDASNLALEGRTILPEAANRFRVLELEQEIRDLNKAQVIELAAGLRLIQKAHDALRIIGYPKRGTWEEDMGIEQIARFVQSNFSLDDLTPH